MENQNIKTAIWVMQQNLGATKNNRCFLQSSINLLEKGEITAATSLLKTVVQSIKYHNDIFQAQINELQKKLPPVIKPNESSETKETIEDFYPLKRGLTQQDRTEKIYFDTEPPVESFEPSGPPLNDEYYS